MFKPSWKVKAIPELALEIRKKDWQFTIFKFEHLVVYTCKIVCVVVLGLDR